MVLEHSKNKADKISYIDKDSSIGIYHCVFSFNQLLLNSLDIDLGYRVSQTALLF